MAHSSLRNLGKITGLSCVVIGVYHFALGAASVPGATDANATVDSRERFYSAFFAGYGFAWLGAARRNPIQAGEVRLLAGLMLLGALGRLLSLVTTAGRTGFRKSLRPLNSPYPLCF